MRWLVCACITVACGVEGSFIAPHFQGQNHDASDHVHSFVVPCDATGRYAAVTNPADHLHRFELGPEQLAGLFSGMSVSFDQNDSHRHLWRIESSPGVCSQ